MLARGSNADGGRTSMKYMGKHRDVDFVVFHLCGVWKYTVGNETRGHYPEQAHAIQAVIKLCPR